MDRAVSYKFSNVDSYELDRAVRLVAAGSKMLPNDFYSGDGKSQYITRVYKICQTQIEDNTQYISPARRKNIGFCLIDNDQANARVKLIEDSYSILLHSGLVVVVLVFWAKFIKLKPKDVRALQSDQSPHRLISTSNLDALWIFMGSEAFANATKVPEFWEFVRYSLEFIVNHEFAHIYRGHLATVATEESTIAEQASGEPKRDEKTALRLQAQEFDADQFAVERISQNFLARAKFAARNRISRLNSTYRRPEFCYQMFCFSIYLVFRMFQFDFVGPQMLRFGGHPPASTRWVRFSAQNLFLMEKNTQYPRELFDKILFHVLRLEHTYASLTGNPLLKPPTKKEEQATLKQTLRALKELSGLEASLLDAGVTREKH